MIRTYDDKDPNSVEIFDWDFTDWLRPNDTIASVVGSAISDSQDSHEDTELVLIGVPEIVTEEPTKVSQFVSGGTRGARYFLTCTITTAQGETLPKTGSVYIDPQ